MLRMTDGRIGMLAVVALIQGAHGIIIYYFSSHLALSTAVVSGVVILVLIQHLGWLGPLFGLFRRGSSQGSARSIDEPEPAPNLESLPPPASREGPATPASQDSKPRPE
jgi:hypothetical protein